MSMKVCLKNFSTAFVLKKGLTPNFKNSSSPKDTGSTLLKNETGERLPLSHLMIYFYFLNTIISPSKVSPSGANLGTSPVDITNSILSSVFSIELELSTTIKNL